MNAIYSIPGLPSYTIDDLYPCRYEVMTFSEKELSNSWLNKIWGYIQSFLAGDIIQLCISVIDAKNLLDRYLKERWSNKKLIEEVKKVSIHERNTARLITGVSGVLGSLAGSATLALGGALVPAGIFLLIALTITALGMSLAGLIAKRGFVRIMEGYTEKKLMDKM